MASRRTCNKTAQVSDSYPCPCCGHRVLGRMPGSYEICPVCFWEDDGVQFRSKSPAPGPSWKPPKPPPATTSSSRPPGSTVSTCIRRGDRCRPSTPTRSATAMWSRAT
ncbi:CPCC family cysteine-rich protein [Streptomyces musisoli]|uniref:CPCC family cysteine-rich protein n=1 Tax=Streptomyces TaxID=1883 RepID=UPI0035575038